MSLIRDLLQSQAAVAGFPTDDGSAFVQWGLGPEEAVARIDEEWGQLGRDPRLGEVVWLTASENE